MVSILTLLAKKLLIPLIGWLAGTVSEFLSTLVEGKIQRQRLHSPPDPPLCSQAAI